MQVPSLTLRGQNRILRVPELMPGRKHGFHKEKRDKKPGVLGTTPRKEKIDTKIDNSGSLKSLGMLLTQLSEVCAECLVMNLAVSQEFIDSFCHQKNS